MPTKERSCFIIGPMRDSHLGDEARLKRLAREVVRPLLDEIGRRDGVTYRVRSPYDLAGDKIMHDVIYAIDRADIVIADLTDSNANVFYELGITHSLGRPCISVMEADRHKIEFDVAAYRHYKIDLDNQKYLEARQTLRESLERAHREVDWSSFENPVIDFFRAPITYISPAFSLAQGYYFNFVRPVVEAMIAQKGSQYLYDIGISTVATPTPSKMDETRLLEPEVRRRLKLQVLVPDRIALAKRNFADRFRGNLPQALVEGNGRTYTCFTRMDEDNNRRYLIDVPTTLRTLEDAVERRMRLPNTSQDAPEWREVEAQEIDRFVLNLRMFIDRHEANPEFADRIEVIRYDGSQPAEMVWFYNLMMN